MFDFLSRFKKQSRYQTMIDNRQLKGAFNNLPNEVIILILSQPILSIRTLYDMMKISKRIFDLCLHVLVHYRFPLYIIEASIDQEGHNRSVTSFSFLGVEAETMCIQFETKYPYPRRYYTNKEVPMIRRMMIRDLRHSRDAELSNLKLLEKEEGRTRIPLPSTIIANSKIMIETKNRRIHKVQKEGVHNVQVFRLFPSPLLPVNRLAWKLEYHIEREAKKEYNLTPLYLDIQFNYFIQLIQDKKEKKYIM